MAQIVFSRDDHTRIEETISYLDSTICELSDELREGLTESEWDFALTYIRQRIRSALEIEVMGRCIAQTSIARGLCDERGADHFLRSKVWAHNYGVTQTADEYFTALSAGHAGKLDRAVEALNFIARNRLFGTLDEEYERLLHPQS